MARNPDQIEQEIRELRQEISARVDNLKERGAQDVREAADGVKSAFADPISSGMDERPYLMLGGALATGVVVGLASGKVHLPLPGKGNPAANGDDRAGASASGPGWLSAVISAAEGLALAEGTDAVRSWLHSSNGHNSNGHKSAPAQAGNIDNELGTSIPPPVP